MLKKNVNISVMFKNCIICVIDLKAITALPSLKPLITIISRLFSSLIDLKVSIDKPKDN